MEDNVDFALMYIKQFTCNKSIYLTNPGFFFLSMGKTGMNIHVQVHGMKNRYLQGEQTLVQTIACVGYCEHMFERSGSIIYQYFDTFFTCQGLVANCFQREEQRRCLPGIFVRRMMNKFM